MNTKFLAFILAVIFTGQLTIAQAQFPPVYPIVEDSSFEHVLDSSFFQVLEDKNGTLAFQEISSEPYNTKFHYSYLALKDNPSSEANTYWYRYQLKNAKSLEARITLFHIADYYDLHIRRGDSIWQHYKTGLLYDWDKKDGFKSAGSGGIPLVLQPKEEILVYERVHRVKETAAESTISVFGTDKFIYDQYISYVDARMNYFSFVHLQEAFLIGVLLISFAFNLFIYTVVREKLYLYFALFLVFLSINRTHNISVEYLRWDNPAYNHIVVYIRYAWLLINTFLILFLREAFRTYVVYPKWDKYLLGILVLNFIFYLLMIISRDTNNFFRQYEKFTFLLTSAIVPLTLFTTLLLFIRKKGRFNRQVIVAAFPLIFIYVVINLFGENRSMFGTIEKLPWIINWFKHNFRFIEIFCLIWFVLFFTWLLFVRFDKLRKENAQRQLDIERVAREKEIEKNELISKQKEMLEMEVAERTADLKSSLEDLKATQSQLIQAEKMASLGELTAGIAHEIQNPLNFVNNFSDVNKELIDELVTEAESGNIDEVKFIAADIRSNEEKINHHGKRADSIVKGMLQHSRTGRGEKEPADINELADEYLRLSYHGLRSKDNRFNADMITNFDSSIGKINVVPQDISRVLLNLYNNAFYALNEKKKSDPGFAPQLTVTTTNGKDAVEIKVQDNGDGIPENVVDKIFQPFFTTKPTGQGTGLGLSLTYDIIKAHGGEIKVINIPGRGATFQITLPHAS
jgi:signal transduction histidine kinase